jgi:alkylation response protein AidB-like acyl-CoA dehydrogenase
MTFQLSEEHAALRDKARAFAEALQGQAADIDRAAKLPDGMAREVRAMTAGDPLALVLAVEELASASAAVAAHAATAADASPLGSSGLRGALEPEHSPRGHLALAAVALGLGRASLQATLAELRQSQSIGTEIEKPHWVVSDVATEIEAARLLTYNAAHTMNEADVAMARVMATAAAARAVEAAVRIVGAEAVNAGHVIERVSRDVRTLSIVLGTEEDQRAVAADGLFPR